MIVKRVKTKTDADGKLVGAPGTCYVKALAAAPPGSIAELTLERAEACDVTPEQFEQLKAFHAGRKFAGEFTLEPREGRAAKAAPAG